MEWPFPLPEVAAEMLAIIAVRSANATAALASCLRLSMTELIGAELGGVEPDDVVTSPPLPLLVESILGTP